jgi:hypothetical protein
MVDFRGLKLAHDCAYILEQSGFPVPRPSGLVALREWGSFGILCGATVLGRHVCGCRVTGVDQRLVATVGGSPFRSWRLDVLTCLPWCIEPRSH